MVNALGGNAEVATQQGSIVATFTGANGKAVYPLHLWANNATVSLSYRWLKYAPAMHEESVRQHWFDELKSIVGDLSTSNLTGFPAFKIGVLSDPEKADQMKQFLAGLVAVLRCVITYVEKMEKLNSRKRDVIEAFAHVEAITTNP